MKKINAFACLTLAGFITLTGCSSDSSKGAAPASTATSSGSGGKVVLDLWWPVTKNDKRNDPYYQAIDNFNKSHPNIEVRAQEIPYDQLRQKIVSAANAGSAPDITVGLNEWVTEFSKMGILPDLTPEVNQWKEKDKIPKQVWSTVDIDNKIVGIPQYLGIRALEYHKDILAKAGVTTPPKTWDELIEVGKKLKDKGVIPFGLSGKSVRLPQELIVYFWQNGTDIAQQMPDGKYRNTWKDNPDELKKATGVFDFYKKMLDQGIISKDEANWGYTEMDTNVSQGRVAMSVNGPWMENYEQEHPQEMKDLEIAPPIYSKQPATFLEVNSLLTYTKSKHHKEAVEFMEWWAEKDAQQLVFPNRSVRSDVVKPGKWGESFTKLVEQGRSWPHVTLGGITQAMGDSVQMVLLGKNTPEETAKWLSDQVNKSLEENGELSKK